MRPSAWLNNKGFIGWNYVVAIIVIAVLIIVILILTGKTGIIISEKLSFFRDLLGIG